LIRPEESRANGWAVGVFPSNIRGGAQGLYDLSVKRIVSNAAPETGRHFGLPSAATAFLGSSFPLFSVLFFGSLVSCGS
jgi:hypothetical protein